MSKETKKMLKEQFADFSASVLSRLDHGEQEHGSRSFNRPVYELFSEIMEELEDVSGWSVVLWMRLRKMQGMIPPPDFEECVTRFTSAFGQPVGTGKLSDTDLMQLRINLIKEELEELIVAMNDGDLVETLDAIGDLIYVVVGLGVTLGLPVTKAFYRIHENNMTKFGADGKPIYNDAGKIIKPEGFVPVDLSDLVDDKDA